MLWKKFDVICCDRIINMTAKSVLEKIKQPQILFVIISIISGYFFLILTPPLWGLDEPSHFSRAYQIAGGRVLPDVSRENRGGLMPDNFYEVSAYRTADILDVKPDGDSILRRADVTNRSVYDSLLSKKFVESEHSYYWTANYSPAAYPGAVIGAGIARTFDLTVGQTFFVARLFSLLMYVAISFAALWLLRRTKAVWVFFILALIPTAVFQASVVTADNVLIALSLLFFAMYTRLFVVNDPKLIRKRLLVGLLVVGALLPLIKINHVFITLTLLVLPATYFKDVKWQWIYKGAAVLLAALPAYIWSNLVKVTDSTSLSQRADQLPVSPSEQIAHVLHNPIEFVAVIIKSLIIHGDSYLHGLFLTISGNTIKAPYLLVLLLIGVLLLAALYAKSEFVKMRRQLILMCMAVLVASVSIFAALYAGFTPVGWWIVDGVQGRYFMPLLLPLVALVAVLIPIQIKVKDSVVKASVVGASIISLVVSIVYIFIALY